MEYYNWSKSFFLCWLNHSLLAFLILNFIAISFGFTLKFNKKNIYIKNLHEMLKDPTLLTVFWNTSQNYQISYFYKID